MIVGLNNITRRLESLSQASKPAAITVNQEGAKGHAQQTTIPESDINDTAGALENQNSLDVSANIGEASQIPAHIAAIFVPMSTHPAVLHAHLPQLIFTASLAHPLLPSTRLVQLPRGSDARLCDALGLPRVSVIGILEGAPHSNALIDLVQKTVPEIDVPWLKEVREEKYLKAKVDAIETFAPVVVKGKKSA